MKPLISICIPTYNGTQYLRECLDSVLAQTFTDFEVLLVDDKSSDKTLDIAQAYAEKDTRIRVICNEKNLGLVGNWNKCIELAQGEWIKFVFQDDLIAPECLQKMLAVSKPNSSMICCLRNFLLDADIDENIQHYYKNRVTLKTLFPKSTEISASDYSKALLNQIKENFVGEPTAVMLRRDIFHRFGNFNPHLIQLCDLEFWTRVAIHTGIIYVPETLATFRVHSNATTAKNHSGRLYRTIVLDPLIFLHDFALHPTYAPLRMIAASQPKPLDFMVMLKNESYLGWKGSKKDLHSLAEWQKMTSLYPGILEFAKLSPIEYIIKNLREKLGFFKQKIQKLPQNKRKEIHKKYVL